MENLTAKIPSWLKNKNGTPRFTTNNDPLFYARLVYDDAPKIVELNVYYAELREKFKELSQKDEPDLDNLMHIAVQAQFFNDCIKEIKKIREEVL